MVEKALKILLNWNAKCQGMKIIYRIKSFIRTLLTSSLVLHCRSCLASSSFALLLSHLSISDHGQTAAIYTSVSFCLPSDTYQSYTPRIHPIHTTSCMDHTSYYTTSLCFTLHIIALIHCLVFIAPIYEISGRIFHSFKLYLSYHSTPCVPSSQAHNNVTPNRHSTNNKNQPSVDLIARTSAPDSVM